MSKGSQPSFYSSFVGKFVERACLRIIRWGTYLIAFTPLVVSGKFFFPFVAPKSLYFMALVEIIFAVYLFLAISFPKYRPKLNILLIAIILFVAVSTLSAVFGVSLHESFWSKYERMGGLLMWSHLLAFFVVISSVFKKKDWLRIFEVSVMVAAVISILAIITARDMGPLVSRGFQTRGGATLGNSSFLASYLLFNAFLALYLFLVRKRKELKIFSGIGFILIAYSLCTSGGRAATLAFFIGIVLLFLLKLVFCEKGRLRLAGILLLLFSLSAGILIMVASVHGDNAVRDVIQKKFSLSVSNDRLLVWKIGWQGLKEKPLLGWGPENFNLVFTKNFDSRFFVPEIYGGDIWYDRAHNIVVDTLVATGILGFLSYCGIFIAFLYALWKKYFSQKIDFLTAGIPSVILFSYLLQNLTVFDMISSFMMLFLVLGFGGAILSEKKTDSESSEEEKFSFKPFAAFIILTLLIVSLFYFIIQPVRSNTYLIEAFQTSEINKGLSLYQKSLETSPLGRYQVREAIVNRGLGKYSQREIAEQIPIEIQKKELDFYTQELEKSIEESPLLFSSYLPLARAYNIYGRIEGFRLNQAEEVLKKAIEVSPGNQQGYWVLAQTRLLQGKFDEAISATEEAVSLEPRSQRANLISIEVAALVGGITGNNEMVMKEIERALQVNPSWSTSIQNLLNRLR